MAYAYPLSDAQTASPKSFDFYGIINGEQKGSPERRNKLPMDNPVKERKRKRGRGRERRGREKDALAYECQGAESRGVYENTTNKRES